MSKCCQMSNDQECSLSAAEAGQCPRCRNKGKNVATLTVKNLVQDHARVSASASYSFCRTPTCDVVYFSVENVFEKKDLKVPVGLKETADPLLLCYCFGYTREHIRRENEAKQSGSILKKIKAEVQAGFCACEVKNPSGTCCLGDITRAMREFEQAASTPKARLRAFPVDE